MVLIVYYNVNKWVLRSLWTWCKWSCKRYLERPGKAWRRSRDGSWSCSKRSAMNGPFEYIAWSSTYLMLLSQCDGKYAKQAGIPSINKTLIGSLLVTYQKQVLTGMTGCSRALLLECLTASNLWIIRTSGSFCCIWRKAIAWHTRASGKGFIKRVCQESKSARNWWYVSNY